MKQKYFGRCSECGTDGYEVTVIDDNTILCDVCLEAYDYIECDGCGEYKLCDRTRFYYLADGRILCGSCAEQMLIEGKLNKDDIEKIKDLTDKTGGNK